MIHITSKQAYDGTLNHKIAAAIVPEYSRIAESTYTRVIPIIIQFFALKYQWNYT